jgi:L-2-hydroxyglutarate oxidase LhgO
MVQTVKLFYCLYISYLDEVQTLAGGFPVSGLFMVCKNQKVVEQHHAKVYGKAKVGAPPMSVPHLDTRYIDNKKALLFGPMMLLYNFLVFTYHK